MKKLVLLLVMVITTGCFMQKPPFVEELRGYYSEEGVMTYHTGRYLEGEYVEYKMDMSEVDMDSFEVYPGNKDFAYDKDSVFCKATLIKGADPKTFTIINGNYSKDKNTVFLMYSSTSPSFKNCGIVQFNRDVDVDTFEEVKTNIYSKDKNTAYFEGLSMERSDPKTFEPIDALYSKDSKHVFFEDRTIDGADPKTFKGFDNASNRNYFYIDSNDVFIWGEMVDQADPETIEIVNSHYWKDKDTVFYGDEIVVGADASTFQALNDNYDWDYWARDKDHLYNVGLTLFGVDPNTFEPLGWGYYKDANYIYKTGEDIEPNSYTEALYMIMLERISLADYDTFEVLENGYAKDKRYKFYNGEIVETIEPHLPR